MSAGSTLLENPGGASMPGGADSGLSPMWTAVIGFAIIAVLFEIYIRNTREYKLTKNMPSPPRLPIVGHGHMAFNLSNAEIMAEAMKYIDSPGSVARVMLGPVIAVALWNPVDIEAVLSTSSHLEKAPEYKYFQPWFGNGILISKGHHWSHHRKMIAPTFHQSILKSFIPTFVQHSKNVVERMTHEVGKEFDVHNYMSQTTVEILLSTVMGVKKLPEPNKCLEYAKAVVDMCDIIHKRQLKIYYRLDSLFQFSKLNDKSHNLLNTILNMTRKVVDERQKNFNADARAIVENVTEAEARKQKAKKTEGLRDDLDDIDENDVGAKKRLALLDAMMEMSKNPEIEWTEKDIMDEVNTIMFEGHDTTSAASSFTLCILGVYPDIQEKVMEEQRAIFGDDLMRDCTFNDTMEMKYLERVIMETLRLYPPVPMIARRAEHDIKLPSGPYSIPKGTRFAIIQYAIHRDPKSFPNPNKFDPDNFLPERMAKRHYYSYIPFSAGARSCVGRKFAMLKLKVLLSTIIRNFIVKSNQREEDFRMQADIILKMENGFNISLEPRLTGKAM
ncbi:cytochrome P450 4g1-like [Musca vetustissima]|uniref:cytochrome P450 4g1-like n=1 Tax=Musca vetustissima TaxID=27455 RepID=UPI002AB7EA3B|nr:cytochrome P450 4g1-like [Musca vetustissima]